MSDDVISKAYKRVVEAWGLSEKEALELAGISKEQWAEIFHGNPVKFDDTQVLRISAVLGIFGDLSKIFEEKLAASWMTRLNSGAPFNGARPIDIACAGAVEDLIAFRNHIGAVGQGM